MMNFFAEPSTSSHKRDWDVSESDQGVVVGEEVSQTLGAMLPWSVSILFHLAIILLVLFLGFVILQVDVPDRPITAEPITPPTSEVVVKKLKERAGGQRTLKRDVSPPRDISIPTPDPTEFLKFEQVNFDTVADVFGLDSTAPGTGLFDDEELPNGLKPNRIVFVIDASGSLIDTFPFVISELKRKIRDLDRSQHIAIIFYADDRVIEVPPAGLTRLTADNKKELIKWIDLSNHNIVARGSGDPVNAITRALGYKPQLIYLLSDNITGRGKYAIDQNDLLNQIARANANGTLISTIQYIYEDALALTPGPDGRPLGETQRTLYKIAEMTGGEHTFVRAEDLKIR